MNYNIRSIVVVLYLKHDSSSILLSYSNKYKQHANIQGTVRPNETFDQCAIRELYEETGGILNINIDRFDSQLQLNNIKVYYLYLTEDEMYDLLSYNTYAINNMLNHGLLLTPKSKRAKDFLEIDYFSIFKIDQLIEYIDDYRDNDNKLELYRKYGYDIYELTMIVLSLNE